MGSSLKVGIFTNSFRPVISGVVNSIDLIRRELLRQGHQPAVYAPRVEGFLDRDPGVFRFPSISLSRRVLYPLALPFFPPLHCQIRRSGVEVIHTHHPFWMGDYAWYWARRLGVPLVYTFHTQYEQYCHYIRLPQAPLRALTRWAVRHFARRCDLIIAPSPSIRELLEDYRIGTWTETLENAIDLSAFQAARPERAALRQQLGWPQEATIAIYAGRLGQEKNVSFLLQSLPEKAYCAVVGDGPALGELRRQAAELEISDRVLFTGAVDYPDMPKYYAAADFFAMASVTEVKPLVVLEALASGLPVLAVAACGTADTLQHGKDGLLCQLDREAFRCNWVQMLDPDVRRPLALGAEDTAARYSIGTYARRLVELYREARQRLSA